MRLTRTTRRRPTGCRATERPRLGSWGQRLGLRYLLGNATSTAIQVGDWDWALGEARDPIWDDAEPAERIWLGAIEAEILAARGEPVAELDRRARRIAAGFDDPQYRGKPNTSRGRR